MSRNAVVLTEADTCRTFVVPKLQAVGWDTPPHAINEQRTFTDDYAYNLPFQTRRERAERLRREETAFLQQFGPDACQVLDALIEKYAEHGSAQFKLPEILEVPPFNEWGNVVELASRFGGGRQLRAAVNDLQRRLCAA